METPKTLQEAVQHFTDPGNCRQFMVGVLWLDGVVCCPTCNSDGVVYQEKAGLYKCHGKHPRQKFSLKVGTIFEDSPIKLEKWLPAVWLIVAAKNGISSYEIHRALGVTQKTAWFMLHRIRLAMKTGSFTKAGGGGAPVEVDETFIGGKVKNMHKGQKELRGLAAGGKGKALVFGVLKRRGQVRTRVIANRKAKTVQPLVKELVEPGAKLFTDMWLGNWGLDAQYAHQMVDHMVEYVHGQVHTNGLENFWSLLKRGIGGTYVSVDPFHLQRYLDEQLFRYNDRATKDNPLNDAERFTYAMTQIVGKRLTYAELTGRGLETAETV